MTWYGVLEKPTVAAFHVMLLSAVVNCINVSVVLTCITKLLLFDMMSPGGLIVTVANAQLMLRIITNKYINDFDMIMNYTQLLALDKPMLPLLNRQVLTVATHEFAAAPAM